MPTNQPQRSKSSLMAVAVDHRHGFKPPTWHRRCRLRSFPHPNNPISFLFETEPPVPTMLSPRPAPRISRSLSTPCLNGPRRDHIARLEIIAGRRSRSIHALVVEAAIAFAYGATPIPVNDGVSAAHYLINRFGQSFAVVKPMEDELPPPRSAAQARPSDAGVREVAAYLLDHDNFAGVPPTALIMISRPIPALRQTDSAASPSPFKRIASIQRFMPHDFDAGEIGPSRFSVASVHRIGILDVRILNVDRHAGNILVKKGGGTSESAAELVPIDHGFCLPDYLDDPYFEWLHWPQASVPFSETEAEYVAALDPFRDANLLREELPSLREPCLRILVICTVFLKRAVAAGLCLAEIGHMMTREFCGLGQGTSELEAICRSVEESMRNTKLQPPEVEDIGIQSEAIGGESGGGCLQFEMDDWEGFLPIEVPLLARTGETEGEEGAGGGGGGGEGSEEGSVKEHRVGGIMKSFSFSEARLKNEGISSISFEGLSDEEWSLFLERFEKLLPDAFEARKSVESKQRLGTSCEF